MTSSRREFLKTARLAAGAIALPPWVFDAEASEAAAVNKGNLAEAALLTARKLGATYADIRINRYRFESVSIRDGLWYIENGKIQQPVRNFRFNQSIMQMLAPGNVEMIGVPERVGSSEGQGDDASLLPALKLKQFNFTSQSEAV